jgi:hypothetical protein
MSRTHDTAMYQLRNLYFGLNREEVLELIHSKPLDDDSILYMSPKKNCKLLKYVMNHAQNSENQKRITDFVEWVALKYLRTHVYDAQYVPNEK